MLVAVLLALPVALAAWLLWTRRVRVPCTLDLEATHEHFHAHAALEGVAVQEGDQVQVHGAPSHIPFGEKRQIRTEATVLQASWPRRLMTRVIGTSHITDLYDVGFEG
jgi:hypothetical protein